LEIVWRYFGELVEFGEFGDGLEMVWRSFGNGWDKIWRFGESFGEFWTTMENHFTVKPARAKIGSASKIMELEPKFQFYGLIFNPLHPLTPFKPL
jgi:hypothetical protein